MIDKFGSHILKRPTSSLSTSSLPTSTTSQVYNVVDIKNVKLSYNLVLPFFGIWDESKKIFALSQDKKDIYSFPFKEATIIGYELPSFIDLVINNKIISKPDGVRVLKNDKISFKAKGQTVSAQFVGELIIKCMVEID